MQLNSLGRDARPRGRLGRRRVADRFHYAAALYQDDAATLDDLREAVTTLEDTERIACRVLGGAHPMTSAIERQLRGARAVLRAREAPPSSA